jgi:nucleoside-diphosphate-sugar epimerase
MMRFELMPESACNWAARRVVVTGAAGFIGSHLSRRLASLGAALRLLDNYSTVHSENPPVYLRPTRQIYECGRR